MWFLYTTGDKEGFFAIGFLAEPARNRARVFAVLVLLIPKTASPVSGRRLRIELGSCFLGKLAPGFPIFSQLH